MITTHSLEHLQYCHDEAIQFFGAELMLLKEVTSKITDDRLSKAAILLVSCGQTGVALLQLSTQVNTHTREAAMLARSFMETVTNFCYVGICAEKEYRAFLLHPVYKYYHNVGLPKMEDDFDCLNEIIAARKEKQKQLKTIPIVKEALEIFSETKANLNWSKTNLNQRIEALKKWGKFMDVFFYLNKVQYYSDASEALHGSLYGCTYDIGTFDPEFDQTEKDELHKRLYKDSTCILLHLGMLIHESFTLISYSDKIDDIWDYSYQNRGQALNLLWHVIGREIKPLENIV